MTRASQLHVVATLCCALLAWCSHARAQPAVASATQADAGDEAAAQRCAVLLALGDDVPSEPARRKLFNACVSGTPAAGDEAKSSAADVARLDFRGGWRIAEVREAFGSKQLRKLLEPLPTAVHDDWTDQDAEWLRKLARHSCVEKQLEDDAGAGHDPTGLDRGRLQSCLSGKGADPDHLAAELGSRLKGRVIWTVFTQAPLERVSIDSAGPFSLHFDTQATSDAPCADKPRGFSVQVGESTAHLAVLPEGALVTATASPASEAATQGFGPIHRVDVATDDLGFALKLPSTSNLACLDLRIEVNAKERYAVLVDGHPVAHDRTDPDYLGDETLFSHYWVEPKRTHHLHVVRLTPHAGPAVSAVLAEQQIEASQLKAGGEPMPIHLDLRHSKQITMLLTVGSMCEQAGLDPEIVRQQLAQFMRQRFDARFFDPEKLTVMVGAANSLRADGARATVAGEGSRAGLDFMGLLEALSSRELHRGFESIVDARLACSKREPNAAWDYSFAATAHRPEGAPSLGPYALTTSDPGELADIIREPIALMGDALDAADEAVARAQQADAQAATRTKQAYARLVRMPQRTISYRETRLTAIASPDTSKAPASIALAYRKLDRGAGDALCNGVAAYRQLRSATFTSSDAQRDEIASGKGFTPITAEDPGQRSYLLPNDGPGSYLLRVSADGPVPDSAYRCIAVYEPDPQFWGGALGGYEIGSFGSSLHAGHSWRSSFLLGYRVPRRTLRVGVGVGYSLAFRQLEGLTSWNDIATIPSETGDRFDARGGLDLSLRRHSILVFPSLELKLPGYGRWYPWLRLLVPVDAGLLSGDLPGGLDHFAAHSDVDVDFDALVFAGTDVQLTERYALSLMFSAGLYGLDDAIWVNPRARSYDAGVEIGLGVGMAL